MAERPHRRLGFGGKAFQRRRLGGFEVAGVEQAFGEVEIARRKSGVRIDGGAKMIGPLRTSAPARDSSFARLKWA